MPSTLGIVASHYTAATGGGGPLAGYTAWYDATIAASVTQSGGLVTSWADQSGNGYDMTTSGGSRPTWGSDTINSLDVVTFGSGTWLDNTSIPMAHPFTVFAVVKLNDTSGTRKDIFYAHGSGGNAPTLFTNGTVWDYYAGPEVSGGTLDTTAHVFTIAYDAGSAAGTFYIDSASIGTFSGATLDASGGVQLSQHALLGLMGEFIVYSSGLNSTDRGSVESYLKAKWGTP